MTKLSERTAELIEDALRTCGLRNPLDPFFYIEEKMYMNEVDEILRFFKWLHGTDRPYGSANAQQRWEEFKKGDNEIWKTEIAPFRVTKTGKFYEEY